MAVVFVNGAPVDIGNEKLNLIEAAQKGGVFIPHYCWHPALSVVASCRMCLVECGDMKDGKAVMPKVVPGCQTPAKDGTVIVTNSDKARSAQMQTLEGILLNHPLDCPVCDKAGECLLQDYSYHYGKSESRMIDEKNTPPNKPDLGNNISLFTDRCIMCSRCVRFTREIAGTAELQIINRGSHSEIDIFPGEPLNNKLSTNVVDLCPVGALANRDFLYKQRVWYLKSQKSVCPDCSTGCSVHLDANKNVLYRLRPRTNLKAQGHFMCDLGRLGYHYVNSGERLTRPMLRVNNELTPCTWREALETVRERLRTFAQKGGAAVAGVFSPYLTCEEAYLLAKFLRSLSSGVKLALGPVPIVGQDDSYPKDRRGNAGLPEKFTIRAEKCPNRKGVEEVLKHYPKNAVSFEQVCEGVQSAQIKVVFFTAGYPPQTHGWMKPEQLARIEKAECLIVQDFLPSAPGQNAHVVLPGVSWAEKDGTFVNYAGLAQAIHWAVTPPSEARADGQIFLDLLERRGLIHAPTLRAELAKEIPYFNPLAKEELGESGVYLESKTPKS